MEEEEKAFEDELDEMVNSITQMLIAHTRLMFQEDLSQHNYANQLTPQKYL